MKDSVHEAYSHRENQNEFYQCCGGPIRAFYQSVNFAWMLARQEELKGLMSFAVILLQLTWNGCLTENIIL